MGVCSSEISLPKGNIPVKLRVSVGLILLTESGGVNLISGNCTFDLFGLQLVGLSTWLLSVFALTGKDNKRVVVILNRSNERSFM
jgi:hypothetical protein